LTSLTIYDGSSTIGGNKIYLEDRGIFLDFGMNFAKYGQFYQEFLSERSNRGIHDLLELDLIPKLNIYRTDLIPADVDTTSFIKTPSKYVTRFGVSEQPNLMPLPSSCMR